MTDSFDLSEPFGAQPEPEACDGKEEKADAHNGHVDQLEQVVAGAQPVVDYRTVMDLLDEVGGAELLFQDPSSGTVDLQSGEMLLKSEFDHPLFAADIHPVDIRGKGGGY